MKVLLKSVIFVSALTFTLNTYGAEQCWIPEGCADRADPTVALITPVSKPLEATILVEGEFVINPLSEDSLKFEDLVNDRSMVCERERILKIAEGAVSSDAASMIGNWICADLDSMTIFKLILEGRIVTTAL